MSNLRYDFKLIASWVKPNSRVLDLGCGDGSLLKFLQQQKNCSGYGIELNPEQVTKCIDNQVNVIQGDLNEGLNQFDDASFDYVILSLTLQAMRNPKYLLQEIMRVSEHGIVTFPNFAYWKNRLQIAFTGNMPVSENLPYKWHNTPNIHLCTVNDFSALCTELNFNIKEFIAVNQNGQQNIGLKMMPNLFGEIALCQFNKQ